MVLTTSYPAGIKISVIPVKFVKINAMKYLFSLAMLVFAAMLVQAQVFQPMSALTIFSEDGHPFYLILNGERQNDKPETNIRVEDLVQPYYTAKIIFEDKTIPPITKNALMVEDVNHVPQDVTYKIKHDNKGKQLLRFFSTIPITPEMPPVTRDPGLSVYAYGRPQAPRTSNYEERYTHHDMKVNVDGMGVDVHVNTEMPVVEQETRESHHGHHQQNQEQMSYQSTSACMGPTLNPADFQAAVQSVKSSSFDETRLSTAKNILESNCLSVNQISELCKCFSFEESKLELAKYAYSHCFNPNTYFQLNSIFSFDASKKELSEFISGH